MLIYKYAFSSFSCFILLASNIFAFSGSQLRKPVTFSTSAALIKPGSNLAGLLSEPTVGYAFGSIGLVVLLFNRLSVLEEMNDVQSRVDLISVMACSALLLNALTEQEITARDRDPVALVGYSCQTVILSSNIENKLKYSACKWLCETLLAAAGSITSVHVIENRHIIARIGVVGSGDDRVNGNFTPGKILLKSLQDLEEVYLPDVQILPGKVEFTYLPLNCQAVLVVPYSSTGAVIIGSNKAKSLRLADLRRIRSAILLFKQAQ